MISAKRLKFEFDRKFDRFAGQYKKTLRLENIFNIINEAIITYFRNRVRIAETNNQVRNDLRPFEIKEKSLKIIKKKKDYVIAELPPDCYSVLRRNVICRRKGCKDKRLPVFMFKTNNLDNSEYSPFWKSSFEWEQVIGDDGIEGLYLWHNGEFEIIDVIIDYYRQPEEQHCASCEKSGQYEDWNGVLQTKDTSINISENVMNDMIDVSILMARRDLGDSVDYQLDLAAALAIRDIDTK